MKLWILPLMLVGFTEAARILVIVPLASKSHHYIFKPVMAALARRGHEVVYYTACPYEGPVPPGVEQVDLSRELPNFHAAVNVLDYANTDVIKTSKKVFELSLLLAKFALECPSVQKLIHSNEKFDAVLTESYIMQEYVSAFIHKFDAVGIDFLSIGDGAWNNELAGLPDNPSYQVDFIAELTPDMNFWQRVYNTYVNAVVTTFGYYYMNHMEKYVDQYFNYTGHESRPPFKQLLSNRSLILVNYHNAIGFPAPKPSHRKDICCVTITPRKPLPKKLQTFMDDAVNGVIYFSFGSQIKMSHPSNRKLIEPFMRVFAEVPQKVLMKWEAATYEGKLPKNVHLENWFPQQDILAHNNTVLFISHGGYLSLIEAVHFGVPVLGVPFYGDQIKNFIFAEKAGIGKMLRVSEINYENVSRMMEEILSNKTYKEEVTRRSKMIRDRLVDPVDEAVFWIEHVIKYPDALKPKSTSLSFIQLRLLDVYAFIIVMFLFIVFIGWKSITFIVRFFMAKPISVKEKTS